jgi:hypothetical protein
MKPDTTNLLRLLRQRGEQGVTPIDAWRMLGSYRCGARVYELRKAGYPVTTTLEQGPDGSRYARYRLVEDVA